MLNHRKTPNFDILQNISAFVYNACRKYALAAVTIIQFQNSANIFEKYFSFAKFKILTRAWHMVFSKCLVLL